MSNQAEQLQNDLRLIQEVERHTNLYDPRCKDKDSKSRDLTWSVIGTALSIAREYKLQKDNKTIQDAFCAHSSKVR